MDWKTHARRAAHWGLPAALTGLSLGWTVYAVGEILSRQAPAPLAYTVAGIYDAVWLYALAMETAHRRQGSSGTLPSVLGWLFLVTSVCVLVTHGLMDATTVVAVIGAIVPAAAKATLIMAVERDATRISPAAQSQIDAVRSATRDQVAVGRAVTRAKADRQTTAAALDREERKARGKAQKTRHKAAAALARVADKSPVDGADAVAEIPALFSDDDLARVLGEWSGGDTPAVSPGVSPAVSPGVSLPVSPVSPQVGPVSPPDEIPPPHDSEDAAGPADLSGLAEAAAVAGVGTPQPGESLSEAQLTVVLRWLRHSENPPLSYRRALAAYRAAGFSAKEERVRKAYAALVDSEGADA
ncbi:hypothetical protein IAG44_16260 [Streptomyces roseirectus]|uniref:DUF2637 domain-containing protein n=1 Tax=Streptomyces roseirectus TaxID=2768066 RepID=A0A7H0IDG8_9ACTN|nr:hypothetical protein [Streptomyces roseirectus]QNP70834.1 hypothetical protein IAG44_16260 [Streptomyces roseirectus]